MLNPTVMECFRLSNPQKVFTSSTSSAEVLVANSSQPIC